MRLLITMSLSFLFFNCSDKDSVIKKIDIEFKKSLKSVNNTTISADIYMVLPRAGCSSCISTAEAFMIECIEDSLKKKYIKFILTDFDSEKLIKIRYGKYYNDDNLILDKNNEFYGNRSLNSIYPTIYFFDSGKNLVGVSEYSPQKNGMNDINEYFERKIN
jgi:hypothetical protein